MSFSGEGDSRTRYASHEKREALSRLHPIDAYVLREGIRYLLEYLEGLSLHEFPQLVLFPDTTARPLAYAVKEVLNAVCSKRAVAPPGLRFMAAYREGEGVSLRALHERALELEQESRARRLLVVDDTLSSGATLQQIAGAFAHGAVNHIDYFAFYNTRGLDLHLPALRNFERKGFLSILGGGVTLEEIWDEFGLTEERMDEIVDGGFLGDAVAPPTELEEDLIKYKGFTYRLPDMHRLPFTKEAAVGVTKSVQDRYAKRSVEADHQLMRQLREEIRSVAIEVIEKG